MNNVRPEDLIIIDIETAPAEPSFENLNYEWQQLWQEKTVRVIPEGMTAGEFYQHRAGVMAEILPDRLHQHGLF
jgi:hypothetical protein